MIQLCFSKGTWNGADCLAVGIAINIGKRIMPADGRGTISGVRVAVGLLFAKVSFSVGIDTYPRFQQFKLLRLVKL